MLLTDTLSILLHWWGKQGKTSLNIALWWVWFITYATVVWTSLSLSLSLSLCLFQAGNVVTGEMVEELILSGADIIKVHNIKSFPISPTLLAVPPPPLYTPIHTHTLTGWYRSRLSVHDSQEDGSRLPSAQCCHGMCWCSTWTTRPYCISKYWNNIVPALFAKYRYRKAHMYINM